MRKALLRILFSVILIAACVILLPACSMMDIVGNVYDEGMFPEFIDSRESVSDGYFSLIIHTDKNTFTEGEPIDCWAELEYIGKEDSITVYVYGEPVVLDMTSEDVYYENSYDTFLEDGNTLVLYKGFPVRYTLTDSLPKSSSVLPGKYEIDAWAYLDLSPDGAVCYNSYVSAVIEVKAKE